MTLFAIRYNKLVLSLLLLIEGIFHRGLGTIKPAGTAYRGVDLSRGSQVTTILVAQNATPVNTCSSVAHCPQAFTSSQLHLSATSQLKQALCR